MPKKVVIIGAGIGGLGTAALLAKDGYEVIVLEKNEMIGGRARIYKEAGFSFDMGPSWYMMPDAFIKYFGLFNKKPADYFNLKQLDIHYRVFFSPDIIYDIKKELKENYKLFAETEKNGDKKLVKYLENSKFLYNTSMKDLVYQDYESIWPLFNPKIIKNIFKLKLLQSFHKYTSSLFKNKNLQKILEFTTVFLGGSPYETPAFYTLITHTDFNLGVYHPMGGIHQEL